MSVIRFVNSRLGCVSVVRTLGAPEKMFYDSKMFKNVLLSFTFSTGQRAARAATATAGPDHICMSAGGQGAHDRQELALPGLPGYDELDRRARVAAKVAEAASLAHPPGCAFAGPGRAATRPDPGHCITIPSAYRSQPGRCTVH